MIGIEVAYALPDKQRIVQLRVPDGTSLRTAVALSGIAKDFPEIDPVHCALGIFSKLVKAPEATPVSEGDRIEIYRDLKIDPKQARLNRAKSA